MLDSAWAACRSQPRDSWAAVVSASMMSEVADSERDLARSSAVCPSLFVASGSAPAFSSSRTHPPWFRRTASMSSDSPYTLVWFTPQPSWRSTSTQLPWAKSFAAAWAAPPPDSGVSGIPPRHSPRRYSLRAVSGRNWPTPRAGWVLWQRA